MDIYDLVESDDFEAWDVDKRITELQEMDATNREAEAAERAEHDMLTLEEELGELEDFKAQAGNFTGSFIGDCAWEDYAHEYAEKVFGEAVNEPYWDSDTFADDLVTDFTVIQLLGYKFYYRG